MGPSKEYPVAALDVAFDYVPLALALLDRSATFRRVNPALAALLGYRASELVGLTFGELAPFEDGPLAAAVARRLLEQDEADGSVDTRLLHRDGRALGSGSLSPLSSSRTVSHGVTWLASSRLPAATRARPPERLRTGRRGSGRAARPAHRRSEPTAAVRPDCARSRRH